MTQYDLAERIGCSYAHVRGVETGNQALSAQCLERCIEAINCNAYAAVALWETFSEERGAVITSGCETETIGGIVAHVQRSRRMNGLPAVCIQCGAGMRDECSDACPTKRDVQSFSIEAAEVRHAS